MAVSGFQKMVKDQRVRNYSYGLFASMNLARNEAIKNNCNVTVSPAAGGWNRGWTIATSTPTCASVITLKNETAPSGIVIVGAPATSVIYNKSGRLVSTTPSFTIGDSASTNNYTRCLKVEASGLPRTTKGVCT